MRRNMYFSRSLVEALLRADIRTGEKRTEGEVLNKRRPLELPRARSSCLTKAFLSLASSTHPIA